MSKTNKDKDKNAHIHGVRKRFWGGFGEICRKIPLQLSLELLLLILVSFISFSVYFCSKFGFSCMTPNAECKQRFNDVLHNVVGM